jgi:DNA invertase Pin-like site-specific DNA recombinase
MHEKLVSVVASNGQSSGRRRLRLAIAARVSTKDKEQDPETQLRPLREHVAGQENAELVDEFVDNASADDLRGRREWRRLLELAQARKVDVIVVWRLDRAFRSVLDGAQTLKQLRSWGCGLRSLQEPWIDTPTPFGEAMFYITVAWAQLEKQTLAERAKAEGKHVGRPPRTKPITNHRLWDRILAGLEGGHLTRAEAAKRLRVRRAVLDEALRVRQAAGPPATPADGCPLPGRVPGNDRG